MKLLGRLVDWLDARSLTIAAAPVLLPVLRLRQWRERRRLYRAIDRAILLMHRINMKLQNRTYIAPR